MPDNQKNPEEKMIELLTELVKWTKITGYSHVKDILEAHLKTPEQKLAYKLTDGVRTTRDIGNAVKKNHDTIANWWKIWIKAWIAEPIPVMGGGSRAKSLFSLEEFGLDDPSKNIKSIQISDEA